MGYFAGYSNTTGSRNIFLGYEAGYNDNYQSASDKLVIANSNTTSPLIEGDFSASTLNVNGALSATSFSGDGSGLTGIASGATNINGLSDAKTEYNAIYVGSVPSNTTSAATYNVSVGTTALRDVTTGSRNISVGASSMESNTEGSNNVAIGNGAGLQNTTGTGWYLLVMSSEIIQITILSPIN